MLPTTESSPTLYSKYRRALCPALPTREKAVPLDEDEARHLLQVLRLRPGDGVLAIDGKGGVCVARIEASSKKASLAWTADLESTSNEYRRAQREIEQSSRRPTLCVSVLKGEAMQWLIEKAVELGAGRIVPLLCEHTVVKTNDSHRGKWQRMADQALKQCERLISTELAAPVSFKDAIDQYKQLINKNTRTDYLALERRSGFDQITLRSLIQEMQRYEPKPAVSERFWIGPEGGWSTREVEIAIAHGLTPLSLGDHILRAETAALLCLSATHALATHKLDNNDATKPS